MKLLCFFILSIFAVFKSFADIVRDGEPASVHCSFRQEPRSISELVNVPTPWDSNGIYPVLICIKLNGNINNCKNSDYTEIRVMFRSKGEYFRLIYYFDPQAIDASKKTHCHLFHASEFANLLKDRSVTDFGYMIHGRLYATPKDETTATFQVTARVLSYNISQPMHNIEATHSNDRTVHAVICSFPNCAVVAEGLYSATRTELFTIKEGKTPQYEERGGPVTKGMFSVTSFECEPGKCPTRFSALNLKEPATKTALDKCIP